MLCLLWGVARNGCDTDTGFWLGITALLMVTVMRTQLMEGWIKFAPNDTPNRFLMNIQPDQRLLDEILCRGEPDHAGGVFYDRGRWVGTTANQWSHSRLPHFKLSVLPPGVQSLALRHLPQTNRIVAENGGRGPER
ncbi:MAG: hypothetical protein CM1200mP18_17640 [Gammaproteobacteria bacterium]|nr:MAG: hypothetical protein CM1200mP18_17640 [Gammaproteobacteria bacterium]